MHSLRPCLRATEPETLGLRALKSVLTRIVVILEHSKNGEPVSQMEQIWVSQAEPERWCFLKPPNGADAQEF